MKGLGAFWGIAGVAMLVALAWSYAPQARTENEAARPLPDLKPALAALEKRSGGRLGVALMDESGQVLASYRGGERFAMCSTFKLPLAAVVLDGVDKGRWALDKPLPIVSPLPAYSPVTETFLAAGAISVRQAAEAAVTMSDNGAANLLLNLIGGPAAFTTAMREWGDDVTRLDRSEPELNENKAGDPRDTTSPEAMAELVRLTVTARTLRPATRGVLRQWMVATQTGKARIRAGLPGKWTVGDKTGTCGTAYNDVAFIHTGKREYQIAVYLDRPTVKNAAAEAIIAETARTVLPAIDTR